MSKAERIKSWLENGSRQQNARLRFLHPSWPSHRPTLHEPHGGRVICFETMPIGKFDGYRGYCKYCHSEHSNWWMMDQRDYEYDDVTILLCGECEHTSPQENDDPKSSLKEKLKTLVICNTKDGSEHQREALVMLDGRLSRYKPEIKTIQCDRCHQSVERCVRWTDRKKKNVVDSWGFMEFENETVCDRCLGEGYIGDIISPKKKTA